MFQIRRQKGFTVIELLVVVSIIVVLAAVVLVSVTTYITKGKDAGAKGNLSTAVTNGAIYYDDPALGNGTYDNWIELPGGSDGAAMWMPVYNALNDAGYAGSLVASCNGAVNCAGPGTTAWCAHIALKENGNNYCVDSTGNKVEGGAGCALGVCGS